MKLDHASHIGLNLIGKESQRAVVIAHFYNLDSYLPGRGRAIVILRNDGRQLNENPQDSTEVASR